MEYTRYDAPQPRRPIYRVNAFAQASFVFGLLSVFTCMMFFISIPCGALAITFALLSRDNQQPLRGRARKGLWIGVIGALGSTIITCIMIVAAVKSVGGWEAFMNEFVNYYEQMTGISLDGSAQTTTIFIKNLIG